MRHVITALLLTLLLAGCTSVVEGTARKPAGEPALPAIDFDKLDVGRFPTEPRPPLGVAGDPRKGVLIEAQRMADHVLGPWEIEPKLTKWYAFGAMALPAAEALSLIAPGPFAATAARHNFVNGFASARTDEGRTRLLNSVLRFIDDASAAAAAEDLAKTALGQRGTEGPGEKVSIPDQPDTQAVVYTSDDEDGKRWKSVRAFTVNGPYVFMQLAQTTDDTDAATALIGKAVAAQRPEIDRFRATDPSEFAEISVDPDGLLARTIPAEKPNLTFTANAVFGRRGALHFQNDPVRSSTLFSDTGTDVVTMGATTVYRTRDAAGAKAVVADFDAEVESMSQPANQVRNMPDSRCRRMSDTEFYCLAPADRYAIEVHAPTLLQAQQLAAAQYVMLLS